MKEFELPLELASFDSSVNKTFNHLSSSSPQKLPDVNKISHSIIDLDLPCSIPPLKLTGMTKNPSPMLKKFKGSLPSRSVMLNYLSKKRENTNTTLSRNYRQNLTIGSYPLIHIDPNDSVCNTLTLRSKSQKRYLNQKSTKNTIVKMS